MLSPVIRFFQNWKRYGLAVQELSQLSDRELADIGITRSDIPRIAWGAIAPGLSGYSDRLVAAPGSKPGAALL